MTPKVPNVLSIAGSDPSGGAGIQADLKTFAVLEVYGCAVITALTAQNTTGVHGVMPVPRGFLRQQLDAVFEDIRIDAVKIGMLGTADAVRTVAEVLRANRPRFVVLDPVMRSSTGSGLLEPDAFNALRTELLPLVSLITPNTAEAAALLAGREPRTVAELHENAARLVECGAQSALVTGGHLASGAVCTDVLRMGGESWELHVELVPTRGTHGTGCTLSSAIAALVAKGQNLPAACALAQRFVAEGIRASTALRVGLGLTPVFQRILA